MAKIGKLAAPALARQAGGGRIHGLRRVLTLAAVHVAMAALALAMLGLDARWHEATAQTATSLSLTSSPNPSQVGQPVTFTATLSAAGPTPDGPITFREGATVLAVILSSGGVATFTTSSLAAGTHPIVASYPGDSDYAASTSVVVNQVVIAPAGPSTVAISSIIANFLAQRGDLLTGDDWRSRLLDRLLGGGGSTGFAGFGPMTLGAASEDGAGRLRFATSLSQLRAANAQADASLRSGLGMGGDGRAPGPPPPPGWPGARPGLDVWIEGSITAFDRDTWGEEASGSFGLVKLGADYLVSPGFLVGALVQFDRMREKSGASGYWIEGTGWMAGPYAEMRLARNVIADVRGLWGASDNSLATAPGTVDDFHTTRWLVSAGLTGWWEAGPWLFSPSARIVGYRDEQKAFGASNGAFAPAQDVTIGRLIAGPEVSYRYLAPAGVLVEPRVALKGLWTFTRDGEVFVGGVVQEPVDRLRARIEAGVKLQVPQGLRLELSAGYEGLGESRLEAATGKAQLTVPLN